MENKDLVPRADGPRGGKGGEYLRTAYKKC